VLRAGLRLRLANPKARVVVHRTRCRAASHTGGTRVAHWFWGEVSEFLSSSAQSQIGKLGTRTKLRELGDGLAPDLLAREGGARVRSPRPVTARLFARAPAPAPSFARCPCSAVLASLECGRRARPLISLSNL
jgi:hypothetical protein